MKTNKDKVTLRGTMICSFSKDITIETSNYKRIFNTDGTITCDDSDVNWIEEYEKKYFTIEEVLHEFSVRLRKSIENHRPVDGRSTEGRLLKHNKKLLESCEHWIVEECEIVPNYPDSM